MTGIVLEHRGYIATVTYDDGDRDMHGSVINASATLHFAGASIAALRKAFAETIADYETWCAKRGKKPERPYSGKLPLRLSPALHRAVAIAAARHGESINKHVARLIEREVEREDIPMPADTE